MLNKLTVVILTFNEELNLPKCLKSIQGLEANVLVVDSYSTDSTEEIAKEFKAGFIQNTFTTHALQWQFALNTLTNETDWVLGIDADQELTSDLVVEINLLMQSKDILENGFYIARRNYFLDKWIRYGGYYPVYLLKLFRREYVYLDTKELMDHHFYIHGATGKLKYDIIEKNLKENISFWTTKHIKYARLQAEEEFLNLIKSKGNFLGNKDEKRIYFKNVWNKMPLFIRPILYFMYRYVFLLGFLDGRRGLIFHFLQACWYRMMVDSFIYEMRSKEKSLEE